MPPLSPHPLFSLPFLLMVEREVTGQWSQTTPAVKQKEHGLIIHFQRELRALLSLLLRQRLYEGDYRLSTWNQLRSCRCSSALVIRDSSFPSSGHTAAQRNYGSNPLRRVFCARLRAALIALEGGIAHPHLSTFVSGMYSGLQISVVWKYALLAFLSPSVLSAWSS